MRPAWTMCLTLLCVFGCAQPSPAKVAAWSMKQETSANGWYDIVASNKGVRITSRSFGYVIVSKPPLWDVYVLRPRTHEVQKSSLSGWKTLRLPNFTMAGDVQSLGKPVKTEHVTFKNHPMIKYTFAGFGEPTMFWSSSEKHTFVTGVEVQAFDIPLAPEAATIVYKVHNLPILAGCPANVFTRFKSASGGWTLRCSDISQSELADDSQFAVPSGYKFQGKLVPAFFIKDAQGNIEGMSDLLK